MNPPETEVGVPNTGVNALPAIALPVTVVVLLLFATPARELVCDTVAD